MVYGIRPGQVLHFDHLCLGASGPLAGGAVGMIVAVSSLFWRSCMTCESRVTQTCGGLDRRSPDQAPALMV